MRRFLAGAAAAGLLLSLAPAAALAQDSWDGPVPARVRHFEGDVTVQRVHAGETGAALINLPLDVGDRLWTGRDGRVELLLDDGTLLWLDRDTTIDLVSLRQARTGSESLIRLWNGSLIVAREEGFGSVRVDAPEATMLLDEQVLARVDVVDGRSWLSVLDGFARIEAGGLAETVTAGRRSFAEAGTAPAEPVMFNTAERDGFDGWYTARIAELSRTVQYVRRERSYVPREVVHYVADLEPHGNWFYHNDFGAWAWRPVVAYGWAPYRHGRWVYTYGGWSWVSSAPWGWATSHYGRWHHVPAHGWVWFPGRVYSPGWVSWYVGSGYVGWTPLGYYDRPLVSINLWFGGHRGYGYGYHGDHRGYAVQRGRVVAGRGYTAGPDDTWTFVRDGELDRPDLARRAVVERTAVPRDGSSGSVTLQGPLRPRDPRVLVAGSEPRHATPRSLGGNAGSSATTGPRVAVGRGDSTPSVITPGARGVTPSSSRSASPRPGVATSGVSPTPRPGSVPTVSPRPGSGIDRPTAIPRPSSAGLPTAVPRPSSGGANPTIAPRPSTGGSRPTVSPRPSGGSRAPVVAPPPSGGAPRPTAIPRSGIARPPASRGSIGSSRGSTIRRPSVRAPASRPPTGLSRAPSRGSKPSSPPRAPVRKAKPKPKPKGSGSGSE